MALKLVTTCSDLDKHEYDVTSLIFKNNKIYSAADDGKIKMWNTHLEFEKEIQAHPCSVYSLTADNSNLVYSCSSDGSVRAWKADTLEEAGVILQPWDHEIWKIYWGDDKLAVLDDQGIITFYKNGEAGTIVMMLEQIKDIAFKDNLLYTVRDIDLVVTEVLPGDKHQYTCRGTLPGRAPLVLVGDNLCYSSRDGKDIFIHSKKENQFNQIAHIKDSHEMMINALSGCIRGEECLIYSAGWDKNVKQWRVKSDGYALNGVCDVDGYVNVLCVSDDCKSLFAAGANGQIWKISI